ncbi:MAG: hypothetical protein WKF73_11015 [Nocardioidaceae bacterium]
MHRKPFIALLVATGLIAGGTVAGIAASRDDPSRQQVVAQRGARVMPFALDATTHVFEATPKGGTQRVVAKEASDVGNISLIRSHLREEADAFSRGDFADPSAIHGDDMPGLSALRAGYKDIDVRYRDLPDGAEIAYATDNSELAAAVRAWFGAQLRDHADDATTSSQPATDHTSHSEHAN